MSTMTLVRLLLLIAFALGCGAPVLRDRQGRIPRAEAEAQAWADTLEPCSPTPAGDVRITGTIGGSADGIMNQRECFESLCCNAIMPSHYEVVAGSEHTTLIFTSPNHVPMAFQRAADVQECEWRVWDRVLFATPVVVVGSFEGEALYVSEICRPDEPAADTAL